MKIPARVITRFWENVEQGPYCWRWKAYVDTCGYGRMYWAEAGTHVRAHRVSWEIHNGPIPKGMYVCHTCDNPPCANPAHLFLGDQSANMLDCYHKGRGNQDVRRAAISAAHIARSTKLKHCKNGHPKGRFTVTVTRGGKARSICRKCQRESSRRSYAKYNPDYNPYNPENAKFL